MHCSLRGLPGSLSKFSNVPKPVSVTIYVLVTTTESLLMLTTLASSLECSTLTHINCLLLSFTLTFIVCIVYDAICQLF